MLEYLIFAGDIAVNPEEVGDVDVAVLVGVVDIVVIQRGARRRTHPEHSSGHLPSACKI